LVLVVEVIEKNRGKKKSNYFPSSKFPNMDFIKGHPASELYWSSLKNSAAYGYGAWADSLLGFPKASENNPTLGFYGN